MRVIGLLLLAGVGACAEPQAPRQPRGSETAATRPSEAVTPAKETTMRRVGPSATSTRDSGVPPLSTPNALVSKTADAGAAEQDASTEDPRTRALRRIAESAQACHARHTPGVAGKLVLRLLRESDGKVQSATVVREASTKALNSDALERCVLDAAKRETLPAPSSAEESEMQIPLTFNP